MQMVSKYKLADVLLAINPCLEEYKKHNKCRDIIAKLEDVQ